MNKLSSYGSNWNVFNNKPRLSFFNGEGRKHSILSGLNTMRKCLLGEKYEIPFIWQGSIFFLKKMINEKGLNLLYCQRAGSIINTKEVTFCACACASMQVCLTILNLCFAAFCLRSYNTKTFCLGIISLFSYLHYGHWNQNLKHKAKKRQNGPGNIITWYRGKEQIEFARDDLRSKL